MRRAARIGFHLAAGGSLLLCAMAVGAWVWGQWRTVRVARGTPQFTLTVDMSHGELSVGLTHWLNRLDGHPDGMVSWTSDSYPDSDLLVEPRLYFPSPRPPVAGF